MPGVLFLMCAPAFAGKTVLSNVMAKQLDLVRISTDEINDERGLPRGGDGLPPERWEEASFEAVRRITKNMQQGRNLVLDDTCCFRFLRDRYRAPAEAHGYQTVLIYLDVSEDELLRRIASNRETPRRSDLGDKLFRRHLQSFEKPAADEDCLVAQPGGLGSEEVLETWVHEQLSPFLGLREPTFPRSE